MNEMLYKFKVVTKNSNETISEVDFNYLENIKSINIDTKDAIKNLKKYINVCTASFHSIANLTNIKGE